jgi:hypothetical protein
MTKVIEAVVPRDIMAWIGLRTGCGHDALGMMFWTGEKDAHAPRCKQHETGLFRRQKDVFEDIVWSSV